MSIEKTSGVIEATGNSEFDQEETTYSNLRIREQDSGSVKFVEKVKVDTQLDTYIGTNNEVDLYLLKDEAWGSDLNLLVGLKFEDDKFFAKTFLERIRKQRKANKIWGSIVCFILWFTVVFPVIGVYYLLIHNSGISVLEINNLRSEVQEMGLENPEAI